MKFKPMVDGQMITPVGKFFMVLQPPYLSGIMAVLREGNDGWAEPMYEYLDSLLQQWSIF